MAPSLHTPLESLLLFQTLHPFEANVPCFPKISETLKVNEVLRENESFAPARLEPDSLKEHYLQLLSDEIQLESQLDQNTQTGGLSPLKRKRSIQVLQSLDEASQYWHLLPQLLNRLYFRYRDHAIKSIEEEERHYKVLQRELQEIEREEREARLHHEGSSRGDPRGVSSIKGILRHDDEDDRLQPANRSRPSSSNAYPNGTMERVRMDELPLRNGVRKTPDSGGVQQSPIGQKPPGSPEHNTPFLPPPPQLISQRYPMDSPSSDVQRRPPTANQLPPHPATLPSPRSAQNSLPPAERSSASPIILPPIPGLPRSSGSPTGPLDTLADMAGQQYRASSVIPSPRTAQPSGPQQTHQLPQPRNYPPRGYPYYETQPPYQVPYPHYPHGPLPSSHYHPQPAMSPYPNHPPSSAHGSPYGSVSQYPPAMSHYQHPHPVYNQQPGYYPQPPMNPPYVRSQVSRFADQHTPVPIEKGNRRPAKLSPITKSASSTKWKNADASESVRQPSPTRPTDAISPISETAPSPSPEPPQTRPEEIRDQQDDEMIPDVKTPKRRGRPSRGRGSKRRGRGGRAASVISSSHAESAAARTRSHSVISQTDELSIDQPSSTRKIKPDPSRASVQEDDNSIASHTADEGSRKSVWQRRRMHSGTESVEGNRTKGNRKRSNSTVLPPPSPTPAVSSKPGYVLGTRNFPKICAPLINDISTHKLGSLFAKPLTEREAPGYRDLIYRPQDLRSIRSAINAGGRALVKAAESMGKEGISSSIWVPETPDLVPPAGIINSDQLEKELMRIFANAIMFNPEVSSKRGLGPAFRTRQKVLLGGAEEDEEPSDEEIVKGRQDVSVVKDTREMFEAVEKKVAEWRRVERQVDEAATVVGGSAVGKASVGNLRGGGSSEDADELAGNGGDDIVGSVEQEATPEPKSKRRRR